MLKYSLKDILHKKLKLNDQYAYFGIDCLESFMVRHHLMASKSYGDYVSNNISQNRLTIGWILNIFLLIVTLKFGILSLYNPKWLLILLGEFVYKLARIELMSGI